MSFMFNFPNLGDESSSCDTNLEKDSQVDAELRACEELHAPSTGHESQGQEDIPVVSYEISHELCVRCLQSRAVEERLCSQSTAEYGAVQAAKSHSDLLPNIYEGGLKVWECAIDLAKYLYNSGFNFKGKTVAELGCGAGLPGIVAMRGGATEVHFQDYNVEVIENYTVPNVAMNRMDGCTCKCRYFSGDWDSFRHRMVEENVRYEVILTAETIYRQENYSKLSQFFKHCLAPTGVVYLAAKSNYFGVGGGTSDFASFLNKQGAFHTEICHTEGEGLPREIWRISLR